MRGDARGAGLAEVGGDLVRADGDDRFAGSVHDDDGHGVALGGAAFYGGLGDGGRGGGGGGACWMGQDYCL